MKQSEKLKDVLAAIFKRKGRETVRTRLYDSAPEEIELDLPLVTQLGEDDLPVIVSKPRDDLYLIVATGSIITIDHGQTSRIEYSDILDVNIHSNDASTLSMQSKVSLKQLFLKRRSGLESVIEVEEGAPLIGVWNVLMHVAILNQKTKN